MSSFRQRLCVLVFIARAGCATGVAPVSVDPRETQSLHATIPEPACQGTPNTGGPGDWRHPWESPIITWTGDPNHRGFDLITGAGAATQTIRGELKYGAEDKSLEDEAVDLYACRAGAWQKLGTAITDGEGVFSFHLTGGSRLPIGQRALYASVVGDRTSASFVALVLPDGSELAIFDVDGTLTDGEYTFAESLVTGATVNAWPRANEAPSVVKQRNYWPVYLTARGHRFDGDSRSWLAGNGFPLAPVVTSSSLVLLPGQPTIDYKAGAIAAMNATGLVAAVGVGNRATDEAAYAKSAITSQRIYLKMPEFLSECSSLFENGQAVRFDDYSAIIPTLQQLPLAP
jgi:hypothetical protein